MKLSVIICCYNERATIMGVIERTREVDLGGGWEKEIIVVDNYSTDGTREILQELDYPDVRVIFHERNLGKGRSIRTGFENAGGTHYFIQDADTEYDPFEQPLFCRKAQETNAAAVFGSRVLSGEIKSKYLRTLVGNRVITWLANFLFRGNLTDVATASKMVRADVVDELHLEGSGFDLDFELPAKILLAGHEIEEIPISYNPRSYEEGKKIGARDFVEAVLTMLRARLGLSPVHKQTSAAPELRNT
ncbi:MAG TPA: glycosyltransferase family 2 protein [Candidatus Sulfomarinibacteraceae bacterium]|nr:glycosyltransferase family 2 protein [Candidatus Sulfomarinibacteraceae bacterium]